MAAVHAGDLVGWKFRAALVLGHVKGVEGDMLRISPVSRPSSVVSRRREKVLLESEMAKEDVDAAMARRGHMARTATKSRSPKAQAMGLKEPHQTMPEPQAHAAKRRRQAAYKEEAAARKQAKPARGRAAKASPPEEAKAEAEAEEAPPTPQPKKARGRRGAQKAQ